MTRSHAHPSPLLARYQRQAEDALARAASGSASRDADALLEVLELLALTIAVEAVGELGRVPTATRESVRKLGARALLQVGALFPSTPTGDDDDEEDDRAEAARLLGPYARDGLRALAGKEPPAPRRDDAQVLDAELVGLTKASFDGIRLAEIAWRVRESAEARAALSLLTRLDDAHVASAPRLRLAADGASSVRDPSAGSRIAELSLGGHAVELYRFPDGTLAAYAASSVILRLSGADVSSRVSRPGYAEAAITAQTARVDLDVGGAITTLEI